jgi:hypothetical protein
MSKRGNPIPRELAPNFQATKFSRGEVRLDRFLDGHNVHYVLSKVVFELATPP